MAENCKPIYKNLNKLASTGEQQYAVKQWADQNCENDEYLKQEIERLDYRINPYVRKRFNPIVVDPTKSYGFQVNGLNNTVNFNSDTEVIIPIDFSDESLLDMDISDCVIESYPTVSDGVASIHKRAVLPKQEIVTEDFNTKNMKENGGVNTYWYVGYNKAKPYVLYPEWLKNHKVHNIPSIVRAQTFKCGKTGVLESVSLQLETNGSKWVGWGSPLYVQIWPTTPKEVPVTTWNKKKKASEYVYITAPSGTTKQKYKKITSGKNKGKWVKNKNGTHIRQTETIYYPVTRLANNAAMINHPLAEAVFDPKYATPGFHSFVFDTPCNVTKDEHYAIVVFCPLAHWEQAPRIGGWGRNCSHRYNDGDAFLSENNGRSFTRYGKNDLDKIEYKQGKYTPQDFAFECKIVEHSEEYVSFDSEEENYNYLYFKPIFTNPITGIDISAQCSGWDDTDHDRGRFLEFEYSTTGNRNKPEDWHTIGTSRAAITGKPTILFVRAKMWQTSTNNTETPSIQKVNITVHCTLPTSMYVRTQMYNPKITPMLGAAVWGRANAPFTVESSEVECSAELIQDKIVKEHFEVITVSELDEFTYLLSETHQSNIASKTDDDERCTYLVDNPTILETLKKSNVYIKPYLYTDESTTEYLSFDGGLDEDENQIITGFQFSNIPAYPILECQLIPNGEGYYQSYGEWYDYTVDYDNDIITFDETVLDDMQPGKLSVSYNPIFIQGLTNDEMPLILDYFEDTIQVTNEVLENKYIVLRAAAVDPIRHVYLNKGGDNEQELVEDVDFTVDYLTKTIHFNLVNVETDSTSLMLNDIITVVYTPNIEETGLAIGYYAKRKESALNKQCSILPNYLEYKV